MTPSKIKTTKLFAAALGGGLALGAFVAPMAHAEESSTDAVTSFSSEGSSDPAENPDLDRRIRTVLKYGVTTEADIAQCQADWAGMELPALDRSYDFPCPTSPITQEDVDAAKAKTGVGDFLSQVREFFQGFSS